ncbi:uncharacterized protein LOC119376894 [Rhipicephalus sanguineus]|uniref:uncharacterized protein LOC119376894 n=1 Tax=Rhipicephalus sanguineus TaxID=34632 RepID=UPI001893C80C|nr:uncharacterized protein LOC119376894 [Rhipicephalus sanguineus]
MDIDRIKRKRAVVRTSTTKLLNDIATMEDDASLGELEEKINLLSLKEDSLKELDREIESGVEDLEEEIACSETYKERISVAKTKVQRMLRERNCTNTSLVTASLDRTSSSSDQRESSNNIPQVTPTVKLPKLEIGKFNGELRQWQGFWSQFDSTINSNHHLSNVDKFKYLNSYLTGKAAAAVAGLDLSEGNYEVALSLLKERFGRKEVIIEDHMSRLLNIRLWELGAGWDDPLPEEMRAEWDCWCEELQCIKGVSIPRVISRDFRHEETEKVLHIFCDASPKAYGAVAYVACKSPLGIITISLIMAKSRVAPLKRLSLPRLELMGALIGARLCRYVVKALDLQNAATILWTDSTVAMHWIKGNSARWKPFVANRVSELQALTDPKDWRHCPGPDNPADLITRGILPSALLESELWWKGPHWLHGDETHWPTTGEPCPGVAECHVEERKVTVMPIVSSSSEAVLKVEEFSSFSRVVRVTAWIHRFVNNCRNGKERKGGPLRAEEVIDAERYWLAATQGEAFSDDISNLKAQRPLRKGSPVLPFNPYLDREGLMRVGGRLQFTDNHEETKHPIVLPGTHPFTLLLIKKEHVRMLHSGVRDTLAQLRESYWIIRGRQAVKKVIKRCLICRKQSCPPATEPVAPLPADRVTKGNPFDTVGIDFAGPLICQQSRDVRKCYIAIFTCAVTRAVHLELVSDMSTTAFLLAFKRFVARRGICSTIYSDNALTFKRAAKDLKAMFALLKSQEMQSYFAGNQIRWKFIVERAAWWGGFWERLVRSVKVALRKVLGRSSLNFEELTTVLYEVEAVINSRPLTFTYEDAREPEPLSPAHFLVGRKLTTLPPHHLPAEIPGGDAHLSRRWKYRSAMAEGFWRRWRKEYLLELRSAHLSHPTTSSDLKIGDLVLLKEDHLKRHMWKIARIKETFKGRDGRVRACRLALSGGTELKRPIQLLHPLEVDEQ